MKKRWFSIVEMVIVIFVISVWLVSIFSSLSKWMLFVQTTKEKIIAVNISRQMMEWIFNIRNSNFLRWEWEKEKCRLKIDTMNDWWDWDCKNDPWIWSGYYILLNKNISWQKYRVLSWWNFDKLNINDWIQNSDLIYSMCNESWVWHTCSWKQPKSNVWYFFSYIEWKWLYDKSVSVNWWKKLDCFDWNSSDWNWWLCGDNRAKEFRFCVNTVYITTVGTWNVEFCSVITNF